MAAMNSPSSQNVTDGAIDTKSQAGPHRQAAATRYGGEKEQTPSRGSGRVTRKSRPATAERVAPVHGSSPGTAAPRPPRRAQAAPSRCRLIPRARSELAQKPFREAHGMGRQTPNAPTPRSISPSDQVSSETQAGSTTIRSDCRPATATGPIAHLSPRLLPSPRVREFGVIGEARFPAVPLEGHENDPGLSLSDQLAHGGIEAVRGDISHDR